MVNRTFEEESLLIVKGLEKAYKKMVKFKKANNFPLIISENGKVKSIPAKDIKSSVKYKMG